MLLATGVLGAGVGLRVADAELEAGNRSLFMPTIHIDRRETMTIVSAARVGACWPIRARSGRLLRRPGSSRSHHARGRFDHRRLYESAWPAICSVRSMVIEPACTRD